MSICLDNSNFFIDYLFIIYNHLECLITDTRALLQCQIMQLLIGYYLLSQKLCLSPFHVYEAESFILTVHQIIFTTAYRTIWWSLYL